MKFPDLCISGGFKEHNVVWLNTSPYTCLVFIFSNLCKRKKEKAPYFFLFICGKTLLIIYLGYVNNLKSIHNNFMEFSQDYLEG